MLQRTTAGSNSATPLASIVCSPLKSDERVFGAVIAGSKGRREFRASDLQILNAIAAHAAAAVEVARLHRDLKAISRKPVDLIYGVNERPPAGVSLLLALQHVLIALMSLAYPVLVTLEAGGTRAQAAGVVSMSLLAMAFVTALQAIRQGPVGSGYLVPYITSAIYLGPSSRRAHGRSAPGLRDDDAGRWGCTRAGPASSALSKAVSARGLGRRGADGRPIHRAGRTFAVPGPRRRGCRLGTPRMARRLRDARDDPVVECSSDRKAAPLRDRDRDLCRLPRGRRCGTVRPGDSQADQRVAAHRTAAAALARARHRAPSHCPIRCRGAGC